MIRWFQTAMQQKQGEKFSWIKISWVLQNPQNPSPQNFRLYGTPSVEPSFLPSHNANSREAIEYNPIVANFGRNHDTLNLKFA